ncbi:MAG TPA: peptidoglycan DD-metalloendopeptidase family protein [Actinomycetota bacterium]|nr:peptidoglycan DD-metalloendopeptidase family protein [Actinomycetota bacterium]
MTNERRTTLGILLALAMLAGAIGLSPATAGTKEELDEAKADLAAIQSELDAATGEWQRAVFELDRTRAQIADARARIAQLELRVGRIDRRLTRRAVIAFTSGPASTIDILLSSATVTEFSDRLEFLGSMTQGDADLALEHQNAQESLRRERDDLKGLSEQQAREVGVLNAARERIDDRLAAMDARVNELMEKLKQEQAAAKQLVVLGQRTLPGAAIQVCPVAGPNSFVDSFGWPRVGHTHQGIDLIAPFGTPIVAAHPGAASFSSSSSGGLQAYVRGSGGTYTFYAHLSSYGQSGSVSAGTVIGYVGSTGNAGSTNHLHFEYHPGGGAAINPYQMLLAVC